MQQTVLVDGVKYGVDRTTVRQLATDLSKLRKAGPVVVADADRWFKKVRDLAALLGEMELHDDTGDPYDEGYMRAVLEMQAALKGDE